MPILGHLYPLDRQHVMGVTTEEGLYELNAGDEPLFFGCSGDDPYGIRGILEKHLHNEAEPGFGEVTHFRFEVNARSCSHLEDLLVEFEHEHGYLPKFNEVQANAA